MTSAAELVKLVTLELGGKSPIIVFDDAELDKAAEWTAFGCFCTTGQNCSATSRLLVHESIATEFLDTLLKWMKNIKISDPFDEGCRMGPVISKGQYEKVVKFISTAKSEGATILCGGSRPEMSIRIPYRQLFIDGEWREPFNKNRIPIINPATEEIIELLAIGNESESFRVEDFFNNFFLEMGALGDIPAATAEHVEAAVAAARKALTLNKGVEWGSATGTHRAKYHTTMFHHFPYI
ncbi:hypothetical protein KSS87_014336 [Heliosperma pusillum]|nr:hypothetical protein KSS87_014336 [Heliosperma pusillum]